MSQQDELFEAVMSATQCRIAIAGVPKAGKSTRAAVIGMNAMLEPRSTDELVKMEWSAASAEVADWMQDSNDGPWIIEGCTVGRAIRKWFTAGQWPMPARPCDVLIWMPTPLEILSTGQQRMATACHTIYDEILPMVHDRGVRVLVWS